MKIKEISKECLLLKPYQEQSQSNFETVDKRTLTYKVEHADEYTPGSIVVMKPSYQAQRVTVGGENYFYALSEDVLGVLA